MRFSLDADTNHYSIRNYGPGWITVNDLEIRRSVIITPDQLVLDWPPQAFTELAESHFAAIAALEPEIVLLGTGVRQQFPHPRLTQALLTRGIGIEVMDTTAACRTYNVIMLEGRRVAAALLLAMDS
jgi:uncharacterized protein